MAKASKVAVTRPKTFQDAWLLLQSHLPCAQELKRWAASPRTRVEIGTKTNLLWYAGDDEFMYLHRADGPAKIVTGESGEVEKVFFSLHAKWHRDGAPAMLQFGWKGKLSSFEFYDFGLLSNMTGPSRIYYVKDEAGYFLSESGDSPFDVLVVQYHLKGELVEELRFSRCGR